MEDFLKLANTVDGITTFSDFHAHQFQEFSKLDKEFGTDRFKEQCRVLDDVFNQAEKGNHMVVFAGDLFHKRGAVDTLVMNQVIRVFKNHSKTPVILVRGNHDSKTNSLYTESSLEPLALLDNVIIASEPTVIETDRANFVCLPYGDEVAEMKEFLKGAVDNKDTSKYNYLVAHVGVSGAVTGKTSHRLEGAFGSEDLYPTEFDAVILGHYHKRQFIGGHLNMFYCGSTMQNLFSDEGQDKGVFDIVYGELPKFVAIDSTKFITIDVSNLPEDFDEIVDRHYIRLTGTTEEVKSINRALPDNATNIRVMEVKEYNTELRLDITPTMNPIQITQAYATKHCPNALDLAVQCMVEAIQN